MPTTIWSMPSRTQNRTMTSDTSIPATAPASEPSHRSPVACATTKPDEGAREHHALEAHVEDARLLRDRLAQAGEEERHAGAGRPR